MIISVCASAAHSCSAIDHLPILTRHYYPGIAQERCRISHGHIIGLVSLCLCPNDPFQLPRSCHNGHSQSRTHVQYFLALRGAAHTRCDGFAV